MILLTCGSRMCHLFLVSRRQLIVRFFGSFVVSVITALAGGWWWRLEIAAARCWLGDRMAGCMVYWGAASLVLRLARWFGFLVVWLVGWSSWWSALLLFTLSSSSPCRWFAGWLNGPMVGCLVVFCCCWCCRSYWCSIPLYTYLTPCRGIYGDVYIFICPHVHV